MPTPRGETSSLLQQVRDATLDLHHYSRHNSAEGASPPGMVPAQADVWSGRRCVLTTLVGGSRIYTRGLTVSNRTETRPDLPLLGDFSSKFPIGRSLPSRFELLVLSQLGDDLLHRVLLSCCHFRLLVLSRFEGLSQKMDSFPGPHTAL